MKIAICDDSSKDLNNLYALLEEYFNEKNTKVFIDKFSNPKTLLNKLFLEGQEIYNIFILDIVMQQNGLDVAKRITNIHPHATIIFQTSSSEYAIDAFKVRPFDYILKPLKKEQLFDCLDRLDDFFSESKKNIFQIKKIILIKKTPKHGVFYFLRKQRKMYKNASQTTKFTFLIINNYFVLLSI